MEKQFVDFDQLKESVPILNIMVHNTPTSASEFKPTTEGLRGPCPLCDHRDAFTINTSKNIFHCKKCDERGSPVQLIARLNNITDLFKAGKLLQEMIGEGLEQTSYHIPKKTPALPVAKGNSPETLKRVDDKWNSFDTSGNHEYLSLKKVELCPGLRYTQDAYRNPLVAIPFRDVNGILQTIGYISLTGKFYEKGAALVDSFFLIGDLDSAKEIFLTEGPATAATNWEAMGKQVPVVSFGSAVRMKTAVDAIHEKRPEIKMVVCLEQGEASKQNAKKIAHLPFVSFRMPNFEGMTNRTKQGELSDHNDIVSKCNQPLSVVAEQLQREYTMPETKKTSSVEFDGAKITNHTSHHNQSLPAPDTSFDYLLEPNTEDQIIEEFKNIIPGLPTGYTIGEEELKVHGGGLTVIAAPTGHGKTTVLINFLLNILGLNESISAYLFSYEESTAPIISQCLNSYIGTDLSKDNRNSIESYFKEGTHKYFWPDSIQIFEDKKSAFFSSLISTRRLKVCYTSNCAEKLIKEIKFLRENTNVGVVGIDYMQLLKTTSPSSRLSRPEQLKEICLALKDCAVETGLPIVITAQFSRKVTMEADLSPVNIAEAGDIERIAQIIIGLWNRDKTAFNRDGNLSKAKVLIEREETMYLEILKSRKTRAGGWSVLEFEGNSANLTNKVTESSADGYFKKKHSKPQKAPAKDEFYAKALQKKQTI